MLYLARHPDQTRMAFEQKDSPARDSVSSSSSGGFASNVVADATSTGTAAAATTAFAATVRVEACESKPGRRTHLVVGLDESAGTQRVGQATATSTLDGGLFAATSVAVVSVEVVHSAASTPIGTLLCWGKSRAKLPHSH